MAAEQTVRLDGSSTITTVPSGTQNVSVVSPNPLPVTGTVTTTPSGTQNVAITGQPISTNVVSSAAAPVFTTSVLDQSITGVYGFSLADALGVVAANNFVSIFNPIGSGKTILIFSATVSSYVVSGGSTTRSSLQGTRITAASAGTLQAATAINKTKTSYANPVAEVRTGNPTVTTAANVVTFPPPTGVDTAGTSDRIVAATGAAITCAPGEGLVFRTALGDTDQTWNIAFAWGEA